jgi:alpha/beta superfamily hydrolase
VATGCVASVPGSGPPRACDMWAGHRLVNGTFISDGHRLARYLVLPAARSAGTTDLPGFVFCHGFPVGPLDARQSAGTFPELMDRISHEMGWAAMTFTFRGCGDSQGDFSLQGWLDDLRAAIDHFVAEARPSAIWLGGTSTGGSLAVCVGADETRVRGVATLGARADFDDWANQPRRFLDHAREIGAIRDPAYPAYFDQWARQLRAYRPLQAARRFAPRPLLIVHGDDDDSVPIIDARLLAEAHGSAELRVITGAGHRLRHDPRAIAILLGWLDRQRSQGS